MQKSRKIITFVIMSLVIILSSINLNADASKCSIIIDRNTSIDITNFKKIEFDYSVNTNRIIIKVDNIIKYNEVLVKDSKYTIDSGSLVYKGLIRFEEYNGKKDIIEVKDFNKHAIDFSFIDREKEIAIYNDSKEIYSNYFETDGMKLTLERVSNSKPGISGKTTIINNIDTPYTLDEIKNVAELKAIDDYYGDISSIITIKEENYSTNRTVIGEFSITYQVINEAGLLTEFILIVSNVDITGPIIEGPNKFDVGYSKKISNEEIISKFTVSDNSLTAPSLTIKESTLVNDKIGKYNVVIESIDSSNNSTLFIVEINVYDDVAPVISDINGLEDITINFKDEVSNLILLAGLTANDEIDGLITKDIVITLNNVKNEIGRYSVHYEVKDKYGNVGIYTRYFNVVTLDAPTFWVSDSLLTIEDVNRMSIDQLIHIIASIENINYIEYEVLNDEYSTNYNKRGLYNISFKLTDEEQKVYIISKDINVFSNIDYNQSPKLTDQVLDIYIVLLIFGISFLFFHIFNRRRGLVIRIK